MTKLLISVRDADEARIALAAGVDLIDVKEPSRGSLGASDEVTIAEVLAVVDNQRQVSAAFGELLEFSASNAANNSSREVLRILSFAKIGLAGCASVSDWLPRWARWCESLPVKVVRVAVAYADWQVAAAPPIAEVLHHGAALGCKVLLVDTFDKAGPPLIQLLLHEELQKIRGLTLAANMQLALAGRISLTDIPRLLPLRPDYLAFRGAACAAGRDGNICAERIQSIRQQMRLNSAVLG